MRKCILHITQQDVYKRQDYAIVIDKEPVDESVEVESPESESPTTEADSIQNLSLIHIYNSD